LKARSFVESNFSQPYHFSGKKKTNNSNKISNKKSTPLLPTDPERFFLSRYLTLQAKHCRYICKQQDVSARASKKQTGTLNHS
jgi:hypothetical protein